MRSSLWCYIWRHGIIFNVQWPHFKCCWVCFLHFANSVFKPCFFPFFFTLSRKDFFNLGSWLLQCSKWQKHHAAALVFFIFAITVILIYAAVLPDQSRKICSFQKLLWLMCGLDESFFKFWLDMQYCNSDANCTKALRSRKLWPANTGSSFFLVFLMTIAPAGNHWNSDCNP